jgi:glycosyltransferase involved in cell wall biosynthesis
MTSRTSSQSLLSIVLPVYNEAGVLEELASQVTATARACGMRYEIVFVNDGSRDGSGEALDALAAHDEHVRVVHLARNFGHQAAVQAGLAHARGDAVVLMDSDLQDSPLTIPRFVAAWRDGSDVVYAVRASRQEALWKRLLFAGFHRLLSWMAEGRIPVDAGNFSLMDRRVVRQILALDERDRYLPGLRSWVGFRQRGIEVERHARYDGRPRVSLRGLWRLAKTAMFSFSTFPLTVFYLIGYSALAIFIVLASYSLYCRLFTNLAIPGWTSHILSASFFGALNALGISILGEYVVRIYDQVRGRPVYVVDRTVNADETATPQPMRPSRAGNPPPLPAGRVDDPSAAELLEQLASLIATIQTAQRDGAILGGEVEHRVHDAPAP